MNRTLLFAYNVSLAGLGTAAVLLALGVRWWGFAMCVAEAVTALGCWVWSRRHPEPPR